MQTTAAFNKKSILIVQNDIYGQLNTQIKQSASAKNTSRVHIEDNSEFLDIQNQINRISVHDGSLSVIEKDNDNTKFNHIYISGEHEFYFVLNKLTGFIKIFNTKFIFMIKNSVFGYNEIY